MTRETGRTAMYAGARSTTENDDVPPFDTDSEVSLMTNDVTYSWTTHETTRKAHLIEEVACDRVVACEGDVRSRPVSLCGNIVADHAERREFRGFGNYRDLTWCQMCRAVYQKRQPDTVAAGQEVDD